MGRRYRILAAAISVFLLMAVAACGGDDDASELGDELPSESNEDPADDEASDDGEVTERGTVPNVNPVDVGTATLTMNGETFTFTDEDGAEETWVCDPVFSDDIFRANLANDYIQGQPSTTIFINLPFDQIYTPELSFSGPDFGADAPSFEANWHGRGSDYVDEWKLSEDGLHAVIETDVHSTDVGGPTEDDLDESDLIPVTIEVTCPSP